MLLYIVLFQLFCQNQNHNQKTLWFKNQQAVTRNKMFINYIFWKESALCCYFVFWGICQSAIIKRASHPEVLFACLDLRIYGDLVKDYVSRK